MSGLPLDLAPLHLELRGDVVELMGEGRGVGRLVAEEARLHGRAHEASGRGGGREGLDLGGGGRRRRERSGGGRGGANAAAGGEQHEEQDGSRVIHELASLSAHSGRPAKMSESAFRTFP